MLPSSSSLSMKIPEYSKRTMRVPSFLLHMPSMWPRKKCSGSPESRDLSLLFFSLKSSSNCSASLPKTTTSPSLRRLPGRTITSQRSPWILLISKNSMCAPVGALRPNSLAGITLESFKTRQSPGFRYSLIS